MKQRAIQCLAVFLILIPLLLGLAGGSSAAEPATVRVAAIQCHSQMGQIQGNISNLVGLIRQAAKEGAKIIVTPECAVQGYMEPSSMTSWTTNASDVCHVARVAERIPGPSTGVFSTLAKEVDAYLCIGMIEEADSRFFNSEVLIGPDGSVVAHHRKKALWAPGDSAWCSEGELPVQVVDTPYGRVGLMICFDFHVLPPKLAEQKADIVLYSVGWYGPNERNWFANLFPQKAVIPYGFAVVAANWAGKAERDEWPGRGYSCVITGDGKVLAMARTVVGNEIVTADIPLAQTQTEE